MSTLHLPRRLQVVSQSFKGTDPGAWTTLAVAVATLAAILLAFFFR